MTLIEIIKTSLLGFSALFILIWIFFYILLKIKKSNKQIEEGLQPVALPVKNTIEKPVYNPSIVIVPPIIYPSVNRVNQNLYKVKSHRNQNSRHSTPKVIHKPGVSNRVEKFVVFNKRQYGF